MKKTERIWNERSERGWIARMVLTGVVQLSRWGRDTVSPWTAHMLTRCKATLLILRVCEAPSSRRRVSWPSYVLTHTNVRVREYTICIVVQQFCCFPLRAFAFRSPCTRKGQIYMNTLISMYSYMCKPQNFLPRIKPGYILRTMHTLPHFRVYSVNELLGKQRKARV